MVSVSDLDSFIVPAVTQEKCTPVVRQFPIPNINIVIPNAATYSDGFHGYNSLLINEYGAFFFEFPDYRPVFHVYGCVGNRGISFYGPYIDFRFVSPSPHNRAGFLLLVAAGHKYHGEQDHSQNDVFFHNVSNHGSYIKKLFSHIRRKKTANLTSISKKMKFFFRMQI